MKAARDSRRKCIRILMLKMNGKWFRFYVAVGLVWTVLQVNSSDTYCGKYLGKYFSKALFKLFTGNFKNCLATQRILLSSRCDDYASFSLELQTTNEERQ